MIFPQFRHIGMASKAAKVFSIFAGKFSCLTSSSFISSSTSEHEVDCELVEDANWEEYFLCDRV